MWPGAKGQVDGQESAGGRHESEGLAAAAAVHHLAGQAGPGSQQVPCYASPPFARHPPTQLPAPGRAPRYSASRSPSARSSRRTVPSVQAASMQLRSRLTMRSSGGGRTEGPRWVACEGGLQAQNRNGVPSCLPAGLSHLEPRRTQSCPAPPATIPLHPPATRAPAARTPHAGHRVVQLIGEQAAHARVKAAHAAVHAARQDLGAARAACGIDGWQVWSGGVSAEGRAETSEGTRHQGAGRRAEMPPPATSCCHPPVGDDHRRHAVPEGLEHLRAGSRHRHRQRQRPCEAWKPHARRAVQCCPGRRTSPCPTSPRPAPPSPGWRLWTATGSPRPSPPGRTRRWPARRSCRAGSRAAWRRGFQAQGGVWMGAQRHAAGPGAPASTHTCEHAGHPTQASNHPAPC